MSTTNRISVRDLPDICMAYWHLLAAGWMLFVRRTAIETWLEHWNGRLVRRPVSPQENREAMRAARWSNTAARYPFPWARCLQRSVALCMWLEKKGLAPELRVGVRKDRGTVAAHAWVEFNGRVLNDGQHVKTVFGAFDTRSLGK